MVICRGQDIYTVKEIDEMLRQQNKVLLELEGLVKVINTPISSDEEEPKVIINESYIDKQWKKLKTMFK